MVDFEFRFIVGKMQDFLVKRANDLISLVSEKRFDALIFLDRSARPAAWIFEAFWSSKFPNKPLPQMIFICTGKKDLKSISKHKAIKQLAFDLGSQEEKLRGVRVLIIDDIEKDGTQRRFVEEVLSKLYKPSFIGFFEWNKLGGLRLPHGLSYVDDGSFIAKEDESKKEAVEQMKKEIDQLAKDY